VAEAITVVSKIMWLAAEKSKIAEEFKLACGNDKSSHSDIHIGIHIIHCCRV